MRFGNWLCACFCVFGSFLARAAPPTSVWSARTDLVETPIGQPPGTRQMPRLESKPFRAPEQSAPVPPDSAFGELPESGTVFIREIRIIGNTVLPERELRRVKTRYEQRDNTAAEIIDLKNELTMLYINRGYTTSGAILDHNALQGGVLTLRVIESRLVKIAIAGNEHLSDGFLADRLELDGPLNLTDLENRLRLLREEYLIADLRAELKPGAMPGETILDLTIEENNPFKVDLFYNNQRPPSIGAEQYGISLADHSLFGIGDVLSGWLSKTDGSFNYSASYSVPFTRHDTRLTLSATKYSSAVVVAPFDRINIENDEEILLARLEQPVFRDANHDIRLALGFRHDNVRSFLLGSPFSLSPGLIDGKGVVNALIFGQDWIYRGENHILAVGSIISRGLAVLDSTVNDRAPDSRFWSWLGQFQCLRRFPVLESQILLRGALRLTDSRMLPNEKFAVGGFYSVRGYRENFLTRDQGLSASIEYQIPLPWKVPIPKIGKTSADGSIWIALFGDYGRSWDKHGIDGPVNIGSVGTGLRWRINPESNAQIYYGYRLTAYERLQQPNLQDDGIHFHINLSPF